MENYWCQDAGLGPCRNCNTETLSRYSESLFKQIIYAFSKADTANRKVVWFSQFQFNSGNSRCDGINVLGAIGNGVLTNKNSNNEFIDNSAGETFSFLIKQFGNLEDFDFETKETVGSAELYKFKKSDGKNFVGAWCEGAGSSQEVSFGNLFGIAEENTVTVLSHQHKTDNPPLAMLQGPDYNYTIEERTPVIVEWTPSADADAPLIIDHTCTNITDIPEWAINQAKERLHIAYGHTSHGSQLTTGMTGLVPFMNGRGYPTNLYAYNSGGSGGALDLRDRPFSGANDLGNPNRTAWATATRNYLNSHPEVNVIIWSWCGQVDGSESNINTYLNLMDGLERDYPNVQFVYMTGHLNGTGEFGNVNQRNQQIRNFCIANNKILYDFADIESYDPDGLVNYMRLRARDTCYYDSDGNGSLDRNWAIDWQNSHTQNVDWYSCGSAHSQPLNANQKAYAAWWLWARLAGWNWTPPDNNLPGDANLDGIVNHSDVDMVVEHILETLDPPLSGEGLSNADMDGNGIINILDVQAIVNLILN